MLFKENFKKFKNLKIIEEIKNSNENYFPNSKLIKFYKNSDLYINLSRIESFGITFIEAMASGLPIISFDTPGGRVLIKNKKNGLLIKNGDFEKYINAIISQKKNKIDPKPFNKKYLATYDLRHNAASLVDLYSR